MSRATAEWAPWCDDDMRVAGDTVEVLLKDGRKHCVTIEVEADGFRLLARVAPRGAMGRLEDPEVEIWMRNRALHLVGFRIDRNDTLIGESRVPRAGLDAAEFRFHVRLLAAECDRLEALLTGEDRE